MKKKQTVKELLENISNENDFNFGNKVLYDMCKKNDFEKNLNSKIWLISRSYSASPERKQNTKHKSKDSGGTGQFFVQLAKEIKDNNNFQTFKDNLNEIKKKIYSFKGNNEDEELLRQCLNLVFMFNNILKEATAEIGRCNASDIQNQFSFCTKFLHFHCPQQIFIYDKYSNKGGNLLFKTIKQKNSKKNNEKVFFKKIIDFVINLSANSTNEHDEILNIKQIEFAKHFINAYNFACLLKTNGIKHNLPRKVDNALLRTKKLRELMPLLRLPIF